MNEKTRKNISAAGLLIAIGIVYGDIGTSPLYVMKSIVAGNGGIAHVNRDFIVGSISLVLWTVTLLTTLQTVFIALKATNHGEGGIFALYTLVRKRAKWLVLPALIGGAAILADGTLTPAVTVTTAIEGLKGIEFGHGNVPVSTQGAVIAITVVILLILFSIQRMGTSIIGKAFGPIMFIWFTFLGVMGLMNMMGDLSILQALNPYYAIKLLFSPYNKVGIFILGSIFLATTGAEALYSDVGHVGKGNIIGSWPYVFVCLSLNYFGQGVWILNNPNYNAGNGDFNPFFEIIPQNIRLAAIVLATIAAVIASQALITGSFTLVAEASGLKFLPRMNIMYPSTKKGQIYIPSVNKMICIATIAIVLFFQTSAHMEAAYGLSITISMLMTTILLYEWLAMKGIRTIWNWIFLIFFGFLDIMFMLASLSKFTHGGYVSLIIAGFIGIIKREILYSILDKRPKRARAYWFVTVNVTNEPFTAEYAVNTYGTKNVINVQLFLGFKQQTSVNVYLRQIVHDLIADGTIESQPQEYTTTPGRDVGDFSFVIVNDVISPQTQLRSYEKFLVEARVWLQNLSSNPASWFGLDYADTVIERVPLILGDQRRQHITRIAPKKFEDIKKRLRAEGELKE